MRISILRNLRVSSLRKTNICIQRVHETGRILKYIYMHMKTSAEQQYVYLMPCVLLILSYVIVLLSLETLTLGALENKICDNRKSFH